MAIKWGMAGAIKGIIHYFYSNRCENDEPLRNFNKNKIYAEEIVSFDCLLMNMEELEKRLRSIRH